VPIWVGGRTRRSLRRAVTLADGWIPFGMSATETAEMLSAVDLPAGFDVALPCGPLDPLGAPEDTAHKLSRLAGLGATTTTCASAAESPSQYCDQLAALRDIASDIDAPELQGRTS
jgi:hypothetical protein